jgi:hypothetical protein
MTVEVIEDLPGGVVHLHIGTGKLKASDYEDVIEPAIIEAGDHVRMLVDVDKLPGIELKALSEDMKIGWRHRKEFDRIATVGDSDTVRVLSTVFSPITPGKVRGFKAEERDDAIAWLTEELEVPVLS